VLGILGQRVYQLIDPIGALIIALIILVSWSSTVLEHCQLVAGKCADPAFIKRVTYISMTHDPRILQVDTCRAYHAGTKVIVEVDVILPPETTLQVAHDLGESLQVKLESLASVDRAFVHCDYEATHYPEHRKVH
jgi:divalent metal cation (Fe/Co/Zn/Cd) transporter